MWNGRMTSGCSLSLWPGSDPPLGAFGVVCSPISPVVLGIGPVPSTQMSLEHALLVCPGQNPPD